MTPPHTVLVPLDGSVCATAAIPVAQRLARLLDGTVVLLHIVDSLHGGGAAQSAATLLEHMHLSADDVQGLVIEQRRGEAESVIIQEAVGWQAAAIVMCPQTHTDIRLRTFGHVAKAVLRGAPCPVFLVPPGRGHKPWDLKHVLVPHDGAPSSAMTIAPAADLAAASGAELVVLHVATPVRVAVEPGTFSVPRYQDQPQHEWKAWAREFVDRLCAIGRARSDTRIRLVTDTGEEAGEAIIRFSRQSDLVVLGWRGMLEPDRAVTMQRVIHDAACPVAVFRLDRTR